MEYRMNLRKIGIMIHRFRLQKRSALYRDDFSPDGFLISSLRFPFFDVQPGFPVCSRGTLLHLEQGRAIQEEELYRFFLRKLDLQYAYSPLAEKRYQQFIAAFCGLITDGSLSELKHLKLPVPNANCLLYAFYDRLLSTLMLYYTEAAFPAIELMEEISDLWFCVPENLRPITRIFVLTAQCAHPFYDCIDSKPLMLQHPTHPLDLLCFSFAAAIQQRYILSDKILARYDQRPLRGELPRMLHTWLRYYKGATTHRPRRYTSMLIIDATHPLEDLLGHATVFMLGKHALMHREFTLARLYFSILENKGEPWGIFAAFIAQRPYPKESPENPKLKYLTVYLNEYYLARPQDRLAYLIRQLLPCLKQNEEFLRIYLRFEVIDLVRKTQCYKYVYEYLIKSEIL